jgi:hypothetical protein
MININILYIDFSYIYKAMFNKNNFYNKKDYKFKFILKLQIKYIT